MIIKFDKYKQEKFITEFGYNFEELLQQCENVFGDYKSAIEEVDWYLNSLMELYYNGGEIYRIVTLSNKNELNKSDLGNHWVMDEGCFTRNYGNIKDEYYNRDDYDEDLDYFPFIITANVNPKDIDVEISISQFNELPEEGEIYIENGIPEYVNIRLYEN